MKHRFIALLAAGAVTLSLISCSDNNVPRSSRERDYEKEMEIGQSYAEGGSEPVRHAECPHLSEVETAVDTLTEDICKTANSETVKEDIDALLDLYDRIYEAHTYAEIEFYSNYTEDEAEEAYNKVYNVLYVAADLLTYGFVRGFQSEYKELFEPLITEDDIESYGDLSYDLDTVRSESESSFWDISEERSEYYDIIADDSLSDDEKDLKCAEILIDLLKDYDAESLYSQYDRDYSGEEILALGDSIESELMPAMDKLIDAYIDNLDWDEYFSSGTEYTEPFKVISEYAPLLSDDLGRSAELICHDKLYTICNDEAAFEGAFTDELPLESSATIFIGNMDDDQLLPTAIHEFGHFHATFYDDTPTYLSRNNLDIAEIQSQGLELIFTQFYDELYGDSSDAMKLEQVIDLLDSVISGYLVGEFEYRAVKEKDDLTPQEMVDMFNDIFSYYVGDYHLYMISHIFESPGYYISYATSALATFDLFEDAFNAPDKALERYEKMARISCNSGEFTFRQALSECGFSDVLTADYITDLGTKVNDFAEIYS